MIALKLALVVAGVAGACVGVSDFRVTFVTARRGLGAGRWPQLEGVGLNALFAGLGLAAVVVALFL